MKIVIDENVTYGKEAFEKFGEVMVLPGREIKRKKLIDIDALFVRSITKTNKELLEKTNIKFIGTATIGTDHIDKEYLMKNNIKFCSAPGCNSFAVTEYVFSAITHIVNKYNLRIKSKSIGVIGYGNIGSKVATVARAMGLKVVLNDPPLERKGYNAKFSSLEEALMCDIITFHVPLNLEGIDKTHYLLNAKNISLIKDGSILINASRGSVINNTALKNRLSKDKNLYVVLDVWENEPNYDQELNRLVEIGTPHIAGYSFEGKVNGTMMIYDQFCSYMKREPSWAPDLPKVKDNIISLNNQQRVEKDLLELFSKTYPIINDDSLMRKAIDDTQKGKSDNFDIMRKTYRYRRELNNYLVKIKNIEQEQKKIFTSLRLNIIEK